MSAQVFVFWFLALLAGVSGVIATFAKNIVNAAFGLFFTLLALAGIYVLLGADFLAITQVVIYVGGILVLLLFGVLLTNRNLEDLIVFGRRRYLVGTAVGIVVFGILCTILRNSVWPEQLQTTLEGTTKPLGYLLLQNYLLPFEFSSLTLLAALIGAAYLVRGKDKD